MRKDKFVIHNSYSISDDNNLGCFGILVDIAFIACCGAIIIGYFSNVGPLQNIKKVDYIVENDSLTTVYCSVGKEIKFDLLATEYNWILVNDNQSIIEVKQPEYVRSKTFKRFFLQSVNPGKYRIQFICKEPKRQTVVDLNVKIN
jgi:hypothetical protein